MDFASSQLTLQQWLMLLHFWLKKNSVLDTSEQPRILDLAMGGVGGGWGKFYGRGGTLTMNVIE